MSGDWRSSRVRRVEAAAIAALGYPAIAALGRTLRWRVDGMSRFEAALASGRPPIIAFWHGRILPGTLFFRGRGIVVITSENFDGEWIARIIERFGFGTARGSSSRGARRAMLQLVRDVRAGRPTGFTLDGPRGPARVAQPGALWLARTTGCPVLPIHFEASRHWTLNSWDRTQIPQPFSTVGLAIGEPLHVAADADGEGLETARLELEHRLRLVETRAHRLLAEG